MQILRESLTSILTSGVHCICTQKFLESSLLPVYLRNNCASKHIAIRKVKDPKTG